MLELKKVLVGFLCVATVASGLVSCDGGDAPADTEAATTQAVIETPTEAPTQAETEAGLPVSSAGLEYVADSRTQTCTVTGLGTCKDVYIVLGQIDGYTVTAIGDDAFRGYEYLEGIEIPNTVTSIGKYAFSNCKALTSVVIPDSVTTLGDEAFSGCEALKTVTLGNGLKDMGKYTFAGCKLLQEIEIPASVKGISYATFKNCYRLKKVTINGLLTTIDEDAFNGCTLTDITVSLRRLSSMPRGDMTSLTLLNCDIIEKFSLGGCTNIKSLTLPATVKSIEKSAFDGCKKLTDIYFAGTAEEWSAVLGVADIPESITVHFGA